MDHHTNSHKLNSGDLTISRASFHLALCEDKEIPSTVHRANEGNEVQNQILTSDTSNMDGSKSRFQDLRNLLEDLKKLKKEAEESFRKSLPKKQKSIRNLKESEEEEGYSLSIYVITVATPKRGKSELLESILGISKGPKFHFILPNIFVSLLKSPGRFTETEKKVLEDLKSEVEENRNYALKMCTVDLNLLHEMGACKFYHEISHCINDLFNNDVSHEILDDLIQLLKSLPEQIDNVENIYNIVRTCLESILPKVSTLLSGGLSISSTILTIFIVLFITRRESCTILINSQKLGIVNSSETEFAKLLTSARVKGTKLEKIISSEFKKKIAFGAVDNVAIILEMATIILNSIHVNDRLLIAEMELIIDITNRLETHLILYEKTYEMLEKSSKETLKMRDVTNWTTVIIYHVPTDTNQTAIKSSVKRLLREKARDCIHLERLPTNGNNWLIKVPANHCRALLKEKYIDIAKVKCLVMP